MTGKKATRNTHGQAFGCPTFTTAPPSLRWVLPDRRSQKETSQDQAGFTLIELIVVMIIIATLAAMAVPAYAHHLRVASETILRQDLQVMRQAIDSYTVDKQKAPQSGEDLVTSGYLKVMPIDPITHSASTWTFDRSDNYSSVDQTETGINNVHSGAGNASIDGSSYSTW